MKRYCVVFVLLTLLASSALAQKQLLAIEIIGDGIEESLEITDPNILGTFSIWNGPSVVSRTHGQENPPAYIDPNARDGRFVDWPRGIVVQRPNGLRRYEVTFDISTSTQATRQYRVAYEFDPAGGRGYIYLPKWTNNLIWHGVEGNWLYSTIHWDELIVPLVNRSVSGGSKLEESRLRCIVGKGRMQNDGTIVLQLIKDGKKGAMYVYPPSSDEYAEVMLHIGTIDPDVETPVSCWPRRS